MCQLRGVMGRAETIACANRIDLRVCDPQAPHSLLQPEVAAAAVVHRSVPATCTFLLAATLKIKMVAAGSRPSFVMSADRMSRDQRALVHPVLN